MATAGFFMDKTMNQKYLWTSILVVLLAACNPKKDVVAAQSTEPALPAFTIDQMLAFNPAQRAELNRRCQGMTSQTCADYQSEVFKTRDELAKTLCDIAEVQRLSKGADKALPRSVKCNVYY